ncbi:MAG: cytochrome c class [Fibrobacteres bacterium]|nr:cytochrome c class [Fibrobacterota bacterium]
MIRSLRIGIDRADENNDHQNGAVFFFTGGFGTAALNRMAWNTKENSIVVASWGTIAGNWPNGGSKKPHWKMTIADNPSSFEMKGIFSRAGGLLVQFTKPVDKATVAAGAFTVNQSNYHRTATYGCCVDGAESRTVSQATATNDGTAVFIKIDGIKNNHPGSALNDYVTYLKLGGIKSATGQSLFYSEAWYTLNYQSQKAFDPAATVAVAPRPGAKLAKAMAYRVQGMDVKVSVDLEGEYGLVLADLSGREIASRSGRGASEFAFQAPGARGLYLLQLAPRRSKLLAPHRLLMRLCRPWGRPTRPFNLRFLEKGIPRPCKKVSQNSRNLPPRVPFLTIFGHQFSNTPTNCKSTRHFLLDAYYP